jgi:hypothetical protein
MVLAEWISKMGNSMRASGSKIRCKVAASISTRMEVNTKASGTKINSMALV